MSGVGAKKLAFLGSHANRGSCSLGSSRRSSLGWKVPRRGFACWSSILCPSCQVCVEVSMKLKKQVTVCGAAIFCVAVFSLYLMLDRVQHDPSRHQSGGNFPRVSHAWQLMSSCTSGQSCQLRTEHSCAIGSFSRNPNLKTMTQRKKEGANGMMDGWLFCLLNAWRHC